ncbi:hypothetical protein CLV42_1481, partial [Chitinophaga ginsengisoli]
KLLLGPLSAKKRADLFEISPNFFDPDLFGQPRFRPMLLLGLLS